MAERPEDAAETQPEPPPPGASDTPAGAPLAQPEPSPPLTGWAPPGESASTAGPATGWVMPDALASVSVGIDGYGVAGIGARLVAYWLDSLIISIIPIILTVTTTDWAALFRWARTLDGTTPAVLPITLSIVIVTIVSTGLAYLYFVGFWTGPGQATPGMRILGMRVIDAAGGTTMSVKAATRRWIGLGYPFSVLSLVGPLQIVAGLASSLWPFVLMLTTLASPRRQGLHDRWAGSQVIRSRSSGSRATMVGCLVIILAWIALTIVLTWIAFATIVPELQELIEQDPTFII